MEIQGERGNQIIGLLYRAGGPLYYAGLTIELAAVIIDKSSITNPVQSLMFRAAFVLFAACCVLRIRTYSRREWAVILAAGILAVLCWRVSGRNELIRFLAFVCALRTTDVRRAMEYTFRVTLAGCLGLMALSLAGILGEVKLTTDYGNGLETRWVLGLGHPNSLHCMALMLMLLGLYLYEKSMKLYIYCLLFVGNLLLYAVTDSAMGFLVGAGAILLSLLLHYVRRISEGNLIYLAGELLLAAGLAFSVFAATHDPRKDAALKQFDGTYLSGRIYSLWETIYHEGTLATWKWFGSRFNTYYFDMGWVRLVYWYGIAAALAAVVLTFVLLRHFRRTKNRAAYVLLISLALYTVFEAHLVSEFAGRNYAFFLIAAWLPDILRGGQAHGQEEKRGASPALPAPKTETSREREKRAAGSGRFGRSRADARGLRGKE